MRYVFWIVAFVCAFGVSTASPLLPAGDTIRRPWRVTLFDNATLLPGGDQWLVWGLPVHPGITVGTEFPYRRHGQHSAIFQSVVLGYQYHRYVQHTVQLYSEFGYRYALRWPINLEARLGAGYLHAIPAAQVFKSDNGTWVRKHSWGRPQVMAGLSLGAGLRLRGDWSIVLVYQFYIQTPFVKSYVPVLPNTALHLGVQFPIVHYKKS